MSVSKQFNTFCSNLTVTNREAISKRYKAITRRLNNDFWGVISDSYHSQYVGSYGRGTAIRDFHDLDMMMRLPYSFYEKFNAHAGNGQSALLQAVRNSIRTTYPSTEVGGDGQVVVVTFADRMRFEVLPAFVHKDQRTYTYPNANQGGTWKTTKPFHEIDEINAFDKVCNHNLKQLCRMARAWRRTCDVQMGGLLIDTLAYGFLKEWKDRDKSYDCYDRMSRDFFAFLAAQNKEQEYWRAPGSGQYVYRKGTFEYKAKQCYNLAVEAMKYDLSNKPRSACQEWKKIYGDFYPKYLGG